MSDSAAQLAARKALVNQVFEITGIGVDFDDPVVLAALLQSSYMQTAANRASAEIRREADALATKVARFDELARQIEACSHDRNATLDALAQSVHGIAHDLGQVPAYPGWMSNLALVILGAVSGGVVVLVAGKWLGWLQ